MDEATGPASGTDASASATEPELVGVGGRWSGVVTGEAGVAKTVRPAGDRLKHRVEREIAESIDVQLTRDLVLLVIRGNQLLAPGSVDAVVARSGDGR